jgi:phosphoribosylaminoimidazolecarboxamide formyltransferase/IMP cyclohydrolase
MKKISSALISVYHKEGLDDILAELKKNNVRIYSTGGTLTYLTEQGIDAVSVESVTDYPSVFGGRVKTLHPKIMGGILYRREVSDDIAQAEKFNIAPIDLVVVDLYPFEKTVASGATEAEIIEKIDIGGISLIRAAAKNFNDVMVVPSSEYYSELATLLKNTECNTELSDRKKFAGYAFQTSSVYDTAISNYFSYEMKKKSQSQVLRYGENPHQQGTFFGNLEEVFGQLNGKALSYNNLVDIDAAVNLIADFEEPTFAIIKHTNACGLASRDTLLTAWHDALAGDPVSAFGGVLITNRIIDKETASEIDKLFFEVLIAPDFEEDVLQVLCQKKNRIILKQKCFHFPEIQYKSLLNGVIEQQKDLSVETEAQFVNSTKAVPQTNQIEDLIFANKIAKHTKSNTIVLAKNKQLLGNGTGQTSRVDALRQAISKATEFGKDLNGAVMASDAFFPFPDCVEIAHKAGITAVIQPGGSINDKKSIEYCDNNNIAMILTGIRHFKH